MSTHDRRFAYWRDRVCLGAVALYLLNRFVVKPATGSPTDFFHCYANDVLCLPVWLPVLLWIQRRVGLRTHDFPPTVGELTLHWLLWSWFFEAFAPSFPELWPRTVADPWDIVAYGVGGLAAGLLWRSAVRPRQPRLFAYATLVGIMCVAMIATHLIVEVSDTNWREWHRWGRGVAYERLYRCAAAVEAFRKEHGALPERLGDVAPDYAKDVQEYRRNGLDFVLVDYGEDGAPGGLGDAEDLYYPPDREPASQWYSYFFTKQCRWHATVSGIGGAILAALWLCVRASTTPPFRLPNRWEVARFVLYVAISVLFAAAIISSERIHPGVH